MINLDTLGLGNVDNTRDADKPVSTLQENKLNEFVNTSDFTLLHAIPGLPVRDVSMMFLPHLNFCDINADSKVTKLLDPLSGIELTQTTDSKRPELKVDGEGRQYLRFNGDFLSVDNIEINHIGGTQGNTVSFLFVGKTDSATSQSHFGWVGGTPGDYDLNKRFTAHLPWSTTLYVDSGEPPGGRLTTPISSVTGGATGRLVSYFYERNGDNAKLWCNGLLIKEVTGLTSALPTGVGRFSIGRGTHATSYFAKMDFYGLVYYNRVLTDGERRKMFLFSKRVYGV